MAKCTWKQKRLYYSRVSYTQYFVSNNFKLTAIELEIEIILRMLLTLQKLTESN